MKVLLYWKFLSSDLRMSIDSALYQEEVCLARSRNIALAFALMISLVGDTVMRATAPLGLCARDGEHRGPERLQCRWLEGSLLGVRRLNLHKASVNVQTSSAMSTGSFSYALLTRTPRLHSLESAPGCTHRCQAPAKMITKTMRSRRLHISECYPSKPDAMHRA
jgi:hypothetical protein